MFTFDRAAAIEQQTDASMKKNLWLNRRVKKEGGKGEREEKYDIEHSHGSPLSCKRIKVFCEIRVTLAHVDRINEIER